MSPESQDNASAARACLVVVVLGGIVLTIALVLLAITVFTGVSG
jgi:hypothetical protein